MKRSRILKCRGFNVSKFQNNLALMQYVHRRRTRTRSRRRRRRRRRRKMNKWKEEEEEVEEEIILHTWCSLFCSMFSLPWRSRYTFHRVVDRIRCTWGRRCATPCQGQPSTDTDRGYGPDNLRRPASCGHLRTTRKRRIPSGDIYACMHGELEKMLNRNFNWWEVYRQRWSSC